MVGQISRRRQIGWPAVFVAATTRNGVGFPQHALYLCQVFFAQFKGENVLIVSDLCLIRNEEEEEEKAKVC